MMDIEKLDYRSLIVFESVCRHRNAGLVANELGMTSSAVSRHIAQLREVFQDVLFIRRVQGFVLTDKAEEILPNVSKLLCVYNDLRNKNTHFNPISAKGHFRIYAYNEFTYIIHKVINDLVIPQAPNLTFEVRTLSSDCTLAIENGDIDFAVVYENFKDHNIISEMFSPTESLFLIAHKGHPIFEHEMSIENLCRYGYFYLDNFNDLDAPLLQRLGQLHQQDVEVIGATDNIAALTRHLIDSSCISISCNVFTKEYYDFIPSIQTCTLPPEITSELLAMIDVGRCVGNYLIYSEINQSPTHHWVKNQLYQSLKLEWYKALNR